MPSRLLIALLLAISALPTLPARAEPLPAADELREWGKETLHVIEEHFANPEGGPYREKLRDERPAYLWSVRVQFAALCAAARVDAANVPALRHLADGLETYWTVEGDIGAYATYPGNKDRDRYFDDNAFIALFLAETSDITHEAKYLQQAEKTMAFVLSGEDGQIGGGVYWHEKPPRTKSATTNAPAIVAALRLHQLTAKPQYLEFARRTYAWMNKMLQDRDGFYFDRIALSGRKEMTVKRTWPAALMIRANLMFYQMEQERKYLTEATRLAAVFERDWMRVSDGALTEQGRYAYMVAEALVLLGESARDKHYLELVRKALSYIHAELKNQQGFYPKRWDEPWSSIVLPAQLSDQAAAAAAYFIASRDLPKK